MKDVSDEIELSSLFNLPPEQAIAHLKSKGIHIGWDWQDTLAEAHARSFTIAKMAALDLLSDTRTAIIKAMESGDGYRGFKRHIEPLMRAKGWWGEQTVSNPQGNPQTVKLGSNHRLKTIYQTNRRAAVMAAQYQRQLEAVETHPYWQYSAILDKRTRPHHAAKNGAIYRHDDPFWQDNYPPNGFNCRCTVRAIRSEEAKKQTISTGAGGFRPDKGFAGSPTASHLFDQMWLDKSTRALGQKHGLAALRQDMAADARVKGFLAWVRNTQKTGYSQHRSYGIGILSDKAIKHLQAKQAPDTVGSPLVSFKDKVIAGKKARRHKASGDQLNAAAYEKIIKDFAQPDYELWDKDNQHLLLIFKQPDGKAVKLSIAMYKHGAEVVSGFIADLTSVEGAIQGGNYLRLK